MFAWCNEKVAEIPGGSGGYEVRSATRTREWYWRAVRASTRVFDTSVASVFSALSKMCSLRSSLTTYDFLAQSSCFTTM